MFRPLRHGGPLNFIIIIIIYIVYTSSMPRKRACVHVGPRAKTPFFNLLLLFFNYFKTFKIENKSN